jgi:IclR family pca regulon transcriptional regulator
MVQKSVHLLTAEIAPATRKRGRPPKHAAPLAEGADDGVQRSTLFVNSVAKAMRVLTAFDASRRRLTLSQIATLIEMDLSATQRFTYTLTALGYLRKDEAAKTYELAPRTVDIAFHYLSSSELVYGATPYMHQLSLQTEEATNLTVPDGGEVMIISRIVSRHVLNPHVIAGARLPIYCTAPGLAMMAHMPEEQVNRILKETPLVRHTPATVTAPRAIKARLALIRKAGYAHTEEEYMLGDISTAAAILNASGEVVGAINIAVARRRWGGLDDERRFADLVIAAAASISGRQ